MNSNDIVFGIVKEGGRVIVSPYNLDDLCRGLPDGPIFLYVHVDVDKQYALKKTAELKKEDMKNHSISPVCPLCGSTRLNHERSPDGNSTCADCGYVWKRSRMR